MANRRPVISAVAYRANSTVYFQEYVFKTIDAATENAQSYRPLGFEDPNQLAALSVREYFGSFFTGQNFLGENSNEMWFDIAAPEYERTDQSVRRQGQQHTRRALMLQSYVPTHQVSNIAVGFAGPAPVWTEAYMPSQPGEASTAQLQGLKGDVLDIELVVDDITGAELEEDANPGETAFNYLLAEGLAADLPAFEPGVPAPSYMGNLRDGMYFDDFVFETPSPLSFDEMDQDLGNNPFYVSVRPEYSYLEPPYEENIKSGRIGEQILPNLYAFTSEGAGQFKDGDNSIFNQLITLNGRIEGVMVDQVEDNIKTGEVDQGQYFQKYASAISTMIESNGSMVDLEGLAVNYQNTFFANDSYNILKSSHEKRNVFPMYVELEMNTSTDTAATEVMSELKVNNFVIPRMLHQEPPLPGLQPSHYPLRSITQKREQQPQQAVHLVRPVIQPAVPHPETPVLAINPASFKEDYLGGAAPANAELNNVVVFGPNGDRVYNEMNQDELYKTLAAAVTSAKLEQVYKANKRTFFEILAGKPAHSEVVAYEICKYLSAATPQLVSRTIIPNSNKLDIIKYVDTQVKYGRLYEYRVKQLVLVFGARVYFDNPPSKPLPHGTYQEIGTWRLPIPGLDERFTKGSALARTLVVPNIKLFKVDYAEEQYARVLDDPPLPPEIGFVPHKGYDDRVLINLNNSFGEFLAPPISIETTGDDNDIDKFANVRWSQGKLISNGRPVVRFTGDDVAKEFQIYRLEHWPSSYTEFEGAELEISPLDTTYRGTRYDSRSIIDYLEPNRYYYYTARTVDYHDFISNPTAIYEVRMVSNDGIIMPSIRTVPLAPTGIIRKPSRPMRRYIQVAPSYTNLMVTPEALDEAFRATSADLGRPPETTGEVDIGAIKVGPLDLPTSWGRTFKLRFTSRATGRKFDVNLGINLTKERRE